MYQIDPLHQALLQNTPSPLLLLDNSGRLIDANPAAQALFQGGPSVSATPDIQRWLLNQEQLQARLQAARDSTGWTVNASEPDQLPSEIQAIGMGQGHLYLLRFPQETALQMLNGRLEEANERLQQERQVRGLLRQTRDLEPSNAELNEFAYIAAHDLKEPLRGISNYAGFLLEDYQGQLDAAGLDMLHSLGRLTRRMEQLITQLLHFSRLGQKQLQFEPLDLNALIPEVIESLRPQLDAADAHCTLANPLPSVHGDREQVAEAIRQLIDNAIKFNDKPTKSIQIGSDPDQNPPRIWVRDNGIGINEAYFDKIFKIFKRLHGPEQYGGGTGVGLPIVRKIIQRHGGEVWLDSHEQQGSVFYFTLPVTSPDTRAS